jgi:hypothetical protein
MKDQDRGLDLLQQAVALDPGNSLLLMNTAQQLFTRAHMDAIGDTIRYGVLKQNPDRDMLGYLYQDEAGRAQVYQRLRENDYMKKALAYLDKALLLAPKNAGLYWAANRNYKAFRDLPELQKLLQRLQTASPDLTEAKQSSRDYYSGVRDTNYLARLKSEIGRLETLVETAAVKEHALSLEFVRVELIGCRQGLALYGVPVDGQKILDEARAIHQLHHDSASLGALIGAAFFKADEDLRQQNPEYAQLAQTTRHALGPRLLIASVLARDNSLAKNVGENANVRQALQFTKEYNQRFPASRTPEDWALFRATDPDEAARAIQHVKEDQVTRIASEIEFELNPLSSSAVLEQCWLRKISGDEAGASKIYQEAVKNGVPLPPL